MSEVQIAIIDQEDTQITLAVPGVQGPSGAISSGGSANQVFYKVSGTNYDAGWTFIGNANVDAAAAIAGTKISPNFGSQAIVTTGTNTAASFIPTSATIPSNGIYLPGANQVGVATNGVERVEFGTAEVVFNDGGTNYDFRIEGDTVDNLFFVDASTDRIGIGTSSPAAKLHVSGAQSIFGNGNLTRILADSQTIDFTDASQTAYVAGRINGLSLKFYTNTGAGIDIDSSGKVGIGTSGPALALAVKGAQGYPATSGTTQTGVLRLTGGTELYNVLDMGVNESTDAAWIQSTRANSLATSDKLLLNPNGGNVGIGTTNPGAALHVLTGTNTGVTFQNTSGAGIKQFTDSTAVNADFFINYYGGGGSANGTALIIQQNGTDRARIRSDGMFEVKGAGTAGSSPAFSVSGSAPANSAIIDTSGRLLVGTSTAPIAGELLRVAKASTGTEGAGIRFGGTYELVDSATQTLTGSNATLVFISNNNVGEGALFFLCYKSGTVILIADPSSSFAASDTASKVCVFKSANTDTFTLKNRSGGTKSFTVGKINSSD